ncbi:MAG TPA: TIGR04463 family radical SAM/SPASM RiPP maturase [Methanothrix sp.]|nr:TIGR04463 family radical SAM/SPASM RiPP maturase [Methanothrix sp.]
MPTVSRFNIIIPLKDKRCLAYNSFNGGMALWEPPELEAYESVRDGKYPNDNDGVLKDLMDGGFIFPGYVDEIGILYRQYFRHRYDRSTMILTVAPTMGCNFGCDYCFQGGDKKNESMGKDVQDGIVALVNRVSPQLKRLHIAWYGGEPLLKLDIIEDLSDRIISICDGCSIQFDSMMVTNGYLLTSETARSLSARRVKTIQITLDGHREDHDSRRPLLSGKGTFDQILHNIESIVDEVPMALSIRVNIDSRNAEGVRRLIDQMAEMGFGNRKNLKLYFAPVEATTEACHGIADICMLKGEYGSLERDLYSSGFDLGLTVLPYPPRFRSSCGAVRPRGLVVLPNGDVHKCWHSVGSEERRVGTIFDLDSLNHNPTLKEWLFWNPFQDPRCKECKILPNCAGGCAYKFLYPDDAKGEGSALPCISWRYNINEMLILRAIKMGFIKADDCDQDALLTAESRKKAAFEPCIPLTDPPVLEPPSREERPFEV